MTPTTESKSQQVAPAKPCPFCNASLLYSTVTNFRQHPSNYCVLAGMTLKLDHLDQWNTRAPCVVAQAAPEPLRGEKSESAPVPQDDPFAGYVAVDPMRAAVAEHAATHTFHSSVPPGAGVGDEKYCPNCVSPFKCNGPHIGKSPEHGYETPSPSAERAPVAWLTEDDHSIGLVDSSYPDAFPVYRAPPPDAGTAAPVGVTEEMVKAAQLKLWSLQGGQPVADPRDMRAALEAALLTSRAHGEGK